MKYLFEELSLVSFVLWRSRKAKEIGLTPPQAAMLADMYIAWMNAIMLQRWADFRRATEHKQYHICDIADDPELVETMGSEPWAETAAQYEFKISIKEVDTHEQGE